VIAVDTNILARFYCNDPADPEAQRQRPLARRVMIESPSVFVPLTVVLEFEWVMRGFYGQPPEQFARAIEHLLGMPQVTLERWEAVRDALALHLRGLDFADALHWACSAHCERLVTFDDRGFARRAKRLALAPQVALPMPT
jgi:predicted nucleic-acid-binding protein